MEYLDYLLLAYITLWSVYIYFTHEQEKQSVIAQPETRIAVYRGTMFQLWLPVLILMVLISQSSLSINDIGLRWHWGLANQIAVVVLVLISGYFLLSLKQLSENPESHQAVREQLTHVQWLMPTTAKESRYFVLGISITAGVCEELLFRGYLMQLLASYMPTYGTVIISSIAFGLPHLYQGPINIIRTAAMGVLMALIYLATDSIIVPIILHILIDMYGGAMAYIVLKNRPEEMIGENA